MSSRSVDSHTMQRVRDAGLSIVLLSTLLALILGYLWWGRFQYSATMWLAVAYLGAASVFFINHWLFGGNRRSLGLRLDNWRSSFRSVAPPTVGFALLGLIYGLASGHLRVDPFPRVFLYIPWAFLQQYALNNLLLPRFRTVFGDFKLSLVATALFFALIHSPSVLLIALTFLGALFWGWMFSRVANLFTLSLSHAILAVVTLAVWGGGEKEILRVGKPGYRYEAYGGGVLVAGGYDEQGRPIVVTLRGHDRGTSSLVRVFTPSGEKLREWVAFPEYDFSGNLAVGDLGYGGGDEIVISPGPGASNPARVRIFSVLGESVREFGLPVAGGYGASVAVFDERIYATPGPHPSQGAEVFEFNAQGALLNQWRIADTGLHNSVRAFPFSIPADSVAGASHVLKLALSGTPISVNPSALWLFHPRSGETEPLVETAPTYGLNVAVLRLSGGQYGFLTAPGPLQGYGPHLRIYSLAGVEQLSRVAHQDPRACGANVSAVDTDNDGTDEILMGEGVCQQRPSTVRVLTPAGSEIHRWDAY